MTTEATYSYINHFFSGALDPAWPHVLLIGGTIIGGALVGLGVILEAHKIFSIPTLCVFIGIVIEAACTLLLFGFDEGISSSQRDKIIFLETQIAPRRIDPQQCSDVSASVKSFSGSTVRVDTYSLDIEGGILGWQIADCLERSHNLKVDREMASVLPIGGFGVGVFVSGKDDSLVAAIKGALERAKVRVLDGTGIFSANQLTYRPDASPNPAATVVVGVKPPIDMK